MGMAASQARLLSLTARIHDVEYQAQMIQSAKLKLAMQEDEVYRKYNDALDAQTLTINTSNGLVKANFDNLFGEASINNGINSNYALRTKNGSLVIPDDIFEAYKAVGENMEPHAFAMYMMGVDFGENGESSADYDNALNTFFSSNEATLKKSNLNNIFEQRNNILQQIADVSGQKYVEDLTFISSETSEDIAKSIRASIAGKSDLDNDAMDKIDELLKQFVEVNDKLYNQVFNRYASNIFEAIPGNENKSFDYDKFNYYLRYAKMIEFEGGIDACTCPNEFKTDNYDIKDAESLNEMLMSGKLWLDLVSIDNVTGKVSFDQTSAASDTFIAFNNESTVDKSKQKKAEVEYEHAMKEIDRKDKKFDMDLNRLETERTALTAEYDSVKQVIKDNIDRTFKIFS